MTIVIERPCMAIPGYEGRYTITDDARIFNADGHELKQQFYRRYWTVELWLNGKNKRYAVHRLVLTAFDREPLPGEEGRHRDDDQNNNDLSNLVWGTRSDNEQDKVRNGGHREASKTHCPKGHEYTPENTYVNVKANYRMCRACRRK